MEYHMPLLWSPKKLSTSSLQTLGPKQISSVWSKCWAAICSLRLSRANRSWYSRISFLWFTRDWRDWLALPETTEKIENLALFRKITTSAFQLESPTKEQVEAAILKKQKVRAKWALTRRWEVSTLTKVALNPSSLAVETRRKNLWKIHSCRWVASTRSLKIGLLKSKWPKNMILSTGLMPEARGPC